METHRKWSETGEAEGPSTGEKIKQHAAKQARDARSQMRSIADAGREEVATQLEGFAQALDHAGANLREQQENETASHYTHLVGDQVRSASRYFRERDADAVVQDVEGFARRQPLLFLGGCLVTGLAIGRFLNASPPRPELEEDIGTGEGRALTPSPGVRPVEARPVQTRTVQPVGEEPKSPPWIGEDH